MHVVCKQTSLKLFNIIFYYLHKMKIYRLVNITRNFAFCSISFKLWWYSLGNIWLRSKNQEWWKKTPATYLLFCFFYVSYCLFLLYYYACVHLSVQWKLGDFLRNWFAAKNLLPLVGLLTTFRQNDPINDAYTYQFIISVLKNKKGL